MVFNITFLGTSSMVPTKERNHTSIYLEHLGKGMLVDCGEGTQRQIRIAGMKHSKINIIFITHWHGDHTLGIPGMLQTMGNSDYASKLKIIGPKGTKNHMEHMLKAFTFDCRIEFEVLEIEQDGLIFNSKNFFVEAHRLDHNIESYGYRFIEKDKRRINSKFIKEKKIPSGPLLGVLQSGKSIEWKGEKILPSKATKKVKGKIVSVMLDTKLCDNSVKLSKGADLLISEATYSSHLEEKAEETKHMTSKQVSELASKNAVKTLVLTHLSQRYKTPEVILEEAKINFENVLVAHDFLKLKV